MYPEVRKLFESLHGFLTSIGVVALLGGDATFIVGHVSEQIFTISHENTDEGT
jgi:hypothetical protein